LVYHLQKVSRIKPMAKEERGFRIVGKKSSSKLKGELGFPEVPAGAPKNCSGEVHRFCGWQIFGEKEKTPKR
jgi:hypothetical protein